MAWVNPVTWTPGSTPGATEFNAHIRDMFNAVLPVASLIYRVANATAIETVVENRFLECNGVAVSRATYATLFAYLNALTPALPFGTGDGTTTFNIPDLRGRVPVTLSPTGGHADVLTLGGTEGAVFADRRPKHATSIYSSGVVGSQVPAAMGSLGAGETLKTLKAGAGTGATPNSPIDTPAYLVGGIWYIKYTA
jgi:microcystin-dependent protein